MLHEVEMKQLRKVLNTLWRAVSWLIYELIKKLLSVPSSLYLYLWIFFSWILTFCGFNYLSNIFIYVFSYLWVLNVLTLSKVVFEHDWSALQFKDSLFCNFRLAKWILFCFFFLNKCILMKSSLLFF